jgi:hypothetical protein
VAALKSERRPVLLSSRLIVANPRVTRQGRCSKIDALGIFCLTFIQNSPSGIEDSGKVPLSLFALWICSPRLVRSCGYQTGGKHNEQDDRGLRKTTPNVRNREALLTGFSN